MKDFRLSFDAKVAENGSVLAEIHHNQIVENNVQCTNTGFFLVSNEEWENLKNGNQVIYKGNSAELSVRSLKHIFKGGLIEVVEGCFERYYRVNRL